MAKKQEQLVDLIHSKRIFTLLYLTDKAQAQPADGGKLHLGESGLPAPFAHEGGQWIIAVPGLHQIYLLGYKIKVFSEKTPDWV